MFESRAAVVGNVEELLRVGWFALRRSLSANISLVPTGSLGQLRFAPLASVASGTARSRWVATQTWQGQLIMIREDEDESKTGNAYHVHISAFKFFIKLL